MEHGKSIRKTQLSVTCFLRYGNNYLFLRKNNDNGNDTGKLNGIGGEVNPGEDVLRAVIREIGEKTGFVLRIEDIWFSGVLRIEGGLSEDSVTNVFVADVNSKEVPKGMQIPDGDLLWFLKDDVIGSGNELVDYLNNSFQYITKKDTIFFMNIGVDDGERTHQINTLQTKK